MAVAFAVGEVDTPAVFFTRQRLRVVPVAADQTLPLRQRESAARQLGRAEPAALRVGDAAKAGIDAAQFAERLAVGRHAIAGGQSVFSILAILAPLFSS